MSLNDLPLYIVEDCQRKSKLPYIMGLPYDTDHEQIVDWLVENTNGEWKFFPLFPFMAIAFEHEQDCVLYKLRWS